MVLAEQPDCGASHPGNPGRTCALELGHPAPNHVDEHGDWPHPVDLVDALKRSLQRPCSADPS